MRKSDLISQNQEIRSAIKKSPTKEHAEEEQSQKKQGFIAPMGNSEWVLSDLGTQKIEAALNKVKRYTELSVPQEGCDLL